MSLPSLTPTIPDDLLYEAVDGQTAETRRGARELEIATILGASLFEFARANRLGRALVEFVFRLDSEKDLQHRTDVAFVSSTRWPCHRRVPKVSVWDMIPDLAVEVISESDTAYEVQNKIHEYFDAGVSSVWVIYPDEAEVYVYSAPKQVQVLGLNQELDGGQLIPGFRLPVATLFQDDPE